ncbi:geraniol 8-hydroxylase-like protein [Tanacetum coccineum]
MPPGPTGLPIIGNLLDLGPKPHESLAKLSKKHGPLMTIRQGSITSVVASTLMAAREVLQRNDEACSGRIVPDAVTALDNHDAAVLWIPTNNEWRTIRKALNTCLTHQHKLDSLRNLREKVVHGMLEFLRECMRKTRAVDIGKLAIAVALNQMSNTCLSQNVTTYESDDIGGFKTAVKTLMEVDGKFNIADIFPVLKPLDPQNIRRQAKAAYDWFDNVTEGTETSSNTTEWAMTELLLNPDMFSKLREEISTIVGEDGKIQEAKILDLPYLNAVIKETMRLHLSVPPLVPHKTEIEVKLGEYVVPKNTQVIGNIL